MSDIPYWVVPNARVPITHRLRFAAEVLNAMAACRQRPLPKMASRRVFRMAMEKQRRRRLKLWTGNVR